MLTYMAHQTSPGELLHATRHIWEEIRQMSDCTATPVSRDSPPSDGTVPFLSQGTW